MNFEFRIKFQGLCAYVETPRGLTVFLRNARYPHQNVKGDELPHHSSLIHFKINQLDSQASSRQPDLVRDLWGICFLNHEEITVVEGAGSEVQEPLQIKGGIRSKGSAEPESEAESRDISWVADIAKIVPPSGKIDPRCWQRRPPEDLVVARLELTAGVIEPSGWLTYGHQAVPVWRFAPGGAEDYQQVIAPGIQFKLGGQVAPVTLRLSSFDGGVGRELVFSPRDGASDVEVGIWNVDLADVLDGLYGPGGQSLEPHPAESAAQRDFTSLYTFSEVKPEVLPIPRRLRDSSLGLSSGGNVACPGTLLGLGGFPGD